MSAGVTATRGAETAHAARRASGVVYTPPPLAGLLLDRLLPEAGLDDVLLDPACGEGVFLVEGTRRVRAHFESQGLDPVARDRDAFLRAIEERLWGVDIDDAALAVARDRVMEAVTEISPGDLPEAFFAANVTRGDFLDEETLQALPREPRYIVGNPPYVSTATLAPSARRLLRDRFSHVLGRVDLYVLFMHRCSQVLRDGGRWCLITPDKYLASTYGAPLREFLSETGSVVEVLLFSSHRVFADAATVPCITVWRKGGETTGTVVHSVRRTADRDGWEVPRRATTRTVLLDGRSWQLTRSAGHPDLRSSMVDGRRVLADVATRISSGVATGLNAAFLVQDGSPVEEELLHTTARGRDVQRFSIRPTSRRMLVPYRWDADGRPTLIDLRDYPGAAEWLGSFREPLSARHCVRVWEKPWWDLHDPVTAPLHRRRKVLVPDIARDNRFAADDGTVVPQNTAYYILPTGISAELLALVLNSRPVEYLIKTSAPLMKDGFFRYRRQFLREIPIPTIEDVQGAELLDALNRGDDHELAARVAALYGVDPETVDTALAELAADQRDAS